MPRWRVRLFGEKFDLEEFPRFFTSSSFRVVEDEGDYFLEAELFEGLEGASDVHHEAIRLVRIINGVTKLQLGNFRSVEVGAIVETKPDGTSQGTVFASTDAIIGRAKLVATGTAGDDSGAPPKPGSRETDKWAALALSDQGVEKVLRIWDTRPHDWVNLSNVLDIVGRTEIRTNKWATGAELKRFFQSANDPRHALDDARHGRPSSERPPRRPYMSLAEADRLVWRIVVEWLRWRA